MHFESVGAFGCDQKLFPHFSEAGAAIFTIEQVQYDGHDRPHRLTFRFTDIPPRIFEVIVARQMALRYEPVHRLRQFQSSMAVWLT